MEKVKDATIAINVELDDNKIPEKISWKASDAPMQNFEECKAFMLSIWDKQQKNTLKIDLWTKDMKVDEMNYFFMQTIHTMSDVYLRATGKKDIAEVFKKFAKEFGEVSGLNKK